MLECDLVLKGGVTSGVVYPQAIVEVARKYRLRNLGGTSAGAIGAAVAAAAEYRRQSSPAVDDFSGFDATSEIARELGQDLLGLFQPSPALKGVFGIGIAMMEADKQRRARRVAKAVVAAFPWHVTLPVGLAIVLMLLAVISGNWALFILGIVLGIALPVTALGAAFATAVMRTLPRHDFGICSGLSQTNGKPALTDWLADKIDLVAARDPAGPPLTVGELEAKGIGIAAVTTDLSSHRPYQLPLKSRHHFFSKAEFEQLFPSRVIDYLVGDQQPLADAVPADLYQLPVGPDFPVILVARMSLSFPGLIRAVPLYRFDHQLPGPSGDRGQLRRCLFSDGGISSNFPIHFFDAFLPVRPTFGITLTDWDRERHGDTRVFLPKKWRQSTDLPIAGIDGLLSFLGSILHTAREWQDTLQSLLPGYAERIIEVRLDPKKEGGLNLSMSEATIADLTEYGRQAGLELVSQFDFDEHRWRRALSLLPELENTLRAFSSSHAAAPAGSTPDALTYAQILVEHEPKSYPNSARWRENVLEAFATALSEIGAAAQTEHGGQTGDTVAEGNVPAVDSTLRLMAAADRAPRQPS